MPCLASHQVPAYRLHKSSGRAIVTLSSRDYMLGEFGTADSRRRYHELVAKWEANNRRPIHLAPEELRPALIQRPLTINELCDLFQAHADAYYRKNSRPTSEADTFRLAMSNAISYREHDEF